MVNIKTKTSEINKKIKIKTNNKDNAAKKSFKLVPDTSVVIEGLISRRIEKKTIKPSMIIIHESVMAELESQANKNRETGYLGLEEVKKLRHLSSKFNYEVEFKGNRPTDFEIRHAKSGEIDSIIRQLAVDEKAILVTADKVQALVAESKGVDVILYEFEAEEKPFVLKKYFDKTTMSIHIKENCSIMAKKGKPGNWDYVVVQKEIFDREQVKKLAKTVTEEAASRTDGFLESDRRGSTIIQLANYRIVITRPPFSDGYEITAVKPIKRLALKDYRINDKLMSRINSQAEGILIAGAPGHGKTTFAQALAEYFFKKNKVIKTLEAPRDLSLGDEITQYSMNYGSNKEIYDILLLSRPDYTFFDEMRNTDDFRLFSDLRLSGVGMIGVMHATKPIDSIQRFVGRIELGIIPHVIDTVIFIKDGYVEKIFSLSMEVKVPSGMIEADLARPVVIVNDFNTGRLEFEMYSYGEETVVMPVTVQQASPARRLAEESITREIKKYVAQASVEMLSEHKCKVIVPVGNKGKLIGRQGKTIEEIQNKLGINIDVVEEEQKKSSKREGRVSTISYQIKIDKKNILLKVPVEFSFQEMDIYLEGDYLLSATASKKAIIKIAKQNKIGRIIINAVNDNEQLEIRGS